ncbi:DUF2169 domain-containing protein [Desulfobulbus sp. US4]|nr:DUF2169 domain-containing protein [Desulfobulbus sp. US4]
MEIVNKTGLTIAPLVGRMNFPGQTLTLIMKGTFDLNHGETATVSEEQLYPTGDEFYPDDEQQQSVRYESDFAYYKPKADLLLVGKCHTPEGTPLQTCTATFQVGSKRSTVAVHGNRYKQPIVKTASSPDPFTVMDIRYDNSFGGFGYDKNPVGKGHGQDNTPGAAEKYPLPNIESAQQLSAGNEPAGFGPLNKMWPQRYSKMGTYENSWLKERWPWFPLDFSWEYYNAAPKNMQVNGYLKGDEPLICTNLHPEIPVYQTKLPGLRVRCFTDRIISTDQDEAKFSEVKMNLDTLWVDMEEEKLVLVWRGVTKVLSEDYEEIKGLFIVSEQLDEAPRSVEQYQEAFLTALVAEDAPFEEEFPETESVEEKPTVSIEEEIQKAELEVEKAQEELEKELREAGIEPVQDIPEPSQEDKEMEARILAQYGLDKVSVEETLTREKIIERLANNESFAEEDFSDLDLSELDLRGGDFREAVFSKVNLKNVLLDGAVLIEANFEKADLSGASLKKADACEADFTEASLDGADLSEAVLKDAIFEKATMSQTVLDNAQAVDGYFSEADLSGASLKNAMLDGADFSSTLLHKADFHKASLREATLDAAKGEKIIMSECDLTGLRASKGCCFPEGNFRRVIGNDSTWEKAELTGADCSYSDMEAADFSSAILERVNFLAADMKQARFPKANLRAASCVSMNLFESSFEHANLMQTNFTGSNLYGTEFLGSQLEGTIFKSANLKMTKLANG